MAYDPYNGREDRHLDAMMEDRLSGWADYIGYGDYLDEDLDGYAADDEDRDEDDEEGDE